MKTGGNGELRYWREEVLRGEVGDARDSVPTVPTWTVAP